MTRSLTLVRACTRADEGGSPTAVVIEPAAVEGASADGDRGRSRSPMPPAAARRRGTGSRPRATGSAPSVAR
ncbi:hypothetical protein ACIP27_38520, partial [Streptomyces hydrogenans]|uniref:hypothetical protein n=1 Tax=Streptomyces hydrogenans TaxID=1873719 RepID=UPI0038161AFD